MERRSRPARSSMRMCLEMELSEIGKVRGDFGDARVGVREPREDGAARGVAERVENAIELPGLIFTHMGEYRESTARCQARGQISSLMLTGQWSEPMNVGVDLRFLHFLLERFGDEHVVDSPSHVARARVREMAPPGIVAVALREDAEGVDEAGVHEILEAFALLVGETFLAACWAWGSRGRARCARR